VNFGISKLSVENELLYWMKGISVHSFDQSYKRKHQFFASTM